MKKLKNLNNQNMEVNNQSLELKVSNEELQKRNELNEKFEKLFKLKRITQNDLDQLLTKQEQYLFKKELEKRINEAKGHELDELVEMAELIALKDFRLQVWEGHHTLIQKAIEDYVKIYGILPNTTQIARKTGLSRQTVAKHLKDLKDSNTYAMHLSKTKMLASNVIAKVFQIAMKGDLKACRMFLTIAGVLSHETNITEQNNYIQINETLINEETIRKLSQEQLKAIEAIIKTAIEPDNQQD